MSKKYNAPTLIIIFCFVVSIGSLFNNLMYSTIDFNKILVKQLFNPLNLGWVFERSVSFQVNGLNYIDAIFEGLLLTGAILYAISKRAESRLIRFVVAIIFLSNILSFVSSFAFFCFIKAPWHLSSKDLLIDGLFYAAHLCWIYISYKILQYFNSEKELQVEFYDGNGTQQPYFTDASLWQRVLHPVIDVVVSIMLFSPLMQLFIYIKSGSYDMQFSSVSETVLFGMIVLSRLVYYLLFEAVLGITPAKLLTETRVINSEGKTPAPETIAGRTFLRLIPFESFSFFGYKGLHDKLSNTSVVKEKRIGVNGSYYLWVIPATIVIIFIYKPIQHGYTAYKNRQQFNLQRDLYYNELKGKLQKLIPNDFIALNSVESQNAEDMSTHFLLKVEKIGRDSVTFSVLSIHYPAGYEVPEADVEKAYSDAKETLPKVTLRKRALFAALQSYAYTYMNKPNNAIPLTINNSRYTIKSIDTYFMPNIMVFESYGYGANYFSIDLINKGWKADLINVQILEGDIKITTPLPLHLNSVGRHLNGTTSSSDIDYKLNLTILDTLNRKQLYEVDGNTAQGANLSIKKIR